MSARRKDRSGIPEQQVDLRVERGAENGKWAEPFPRKLKSLLKPLLQLAIVEAKVVKVIPESWRDLRNGSLRGYTPPECRENVAGTRVEVTVATGHAEKALEQRRDEQFMGHTNDGEAARPQQSMNLGDGFKRFRFGKMLENLKAKDIIKTSGLDRIEVIGKRHRTQARQFVSRLGHQAGSRFKNQHIHVGQAGHLPHKFAIPRAKVQNAQSISWPDISQYAKGIREAASLQPALDGVAVAYCYVRVFHGSNGTCL
ncbi:MAG: hypothetical protein WBB96_18570 [Candidatus Dechloromonas phosphoritropha]